MTKVVVVGVDVVAVEVVEPTLSQAVPQVLSSLPGTKLVGVLRNPRGVEEVVGIGLGLGREVRVGLGLALHLNLDLGLVAALDLQVLGHPPATVMQVITGDYKNVESGMFLPYMFPV